MAPVPSPRLNRINKLVNNKEQASDKRIHIESEESAPIKSSSQGNEYTLLLSLLLEYMGSIEIKKSLVTT